MQMALHNDVVLATTHYTLPSASGRRLLQTTADVLW